MIKVCVIIEISKIEFFYFSGTERVKKGVSKAGIDRANRILEKHLNNTDDICKVVGAVYAPGRTIEDRKGLKRNEKRKKRKIKMGKLGG